MGAELPILRSVYAFKGSHMLLSHALDTLEIEVFQYDEILDDIKEAQRFCPWLQVQPKHDR